MLLIVDEIGNCCLINLLVCTFNLVFFPSLLFLHFHSFRSHLEISRLLSLHRVYTTCGLMFLYSFLSKYFRCFWAKKYFAFLLRLFNLLFYFQYNLNWSYYYQLLTIIFSFPAELKMIDSLN